MNLEEVKESFKKYTMQSKASAGREWVYNCKKEPVIVAERLLKDPEEPAGGLRDYKMLCFGGKVEYIICVNGRHTKNYRHIVYNKNWEKQNVVIGESSAEGELEKPNNFNEMKCIAEILSSDFPAARIDLYSIHGKIYFGEITFFPWSGYMRFEPDIFDYMLGDKFLLNNIF